jgi:hypothetical protein
MEFQRSDAAPLRDQVLEVGRGRELEFPGAAGSGSLAPVDLLRQRRLLQRSRRGLRADGASGGADPRGAGECVGGAGRANTRASLCPTRTGPRGRRSRGSERAAAARRGPRLGCRGPHLRIRRLLRRHQVCLACRLPADPYALEPDFDGELEGFVLAKVFFTRASTNLRIQRSSLAAPFPN